MNPVELQQKIERCITGAQAEVRDYTGTGDHFEVTVIAAAFAGKSPVEQHQMVYDALGADVDGRTIHALSLSTKTPSLATSND